MHFCDACRYRQVLPSDFPCRDCFDGSFWTQKRKTIREAFSEMSIEQLAEALHLIASGLGPDIPNTKEAWLDWLREEVKESGTSDA